MKLKLKIYILIVAVSIFIIYKFSKLIDANSYCSQHNCDKFEFTNADYLSFSPTNMCILITFTNAKNNLALQQSFAITVHSLFQHSTKIINLFVVGDSDSYLIAENILNKEVANSSKYELMNLNVDELASKLENVIRPMQDQFSYKPGAYYSHVLFFLSLALHRVFYSNINRVIMLDADLKFNDNVAKLYSLFDDFAEPNIIGIAHEAQPVYRHTFYGYRSKNPNTRVGDPPPKGLPGFNSGVLLLDLLKMRESELYNKLLSAESIKELSREYEFKGHLGDQDFFTLIGMKYEELFYVLPCQWNRQLCEWWRKNGYADVFEAYFACPLPIKLYHGNCGTPIPV